jgi:hypothetical protein
MTEIQIIMTSDLIAVFQSWIFLSYVAISQQPEHMYHTWYSRVGFSYLNIGYWYLIKLVEMILWQLEQIFSHLWGRHFFHIDQPTSSHTCELFRLAFLLLLFSFLRSVFMNWVCPYPFFLFLVATGTSARCRPDAMNLIHVSIQNLCTLFVGV